MLDVIYEDDALVAVNKPANLPVHQVINRARPDLQSMLEKQLGRPLVLFHRLDADTTGVVLLGKQRSINAAIAKLFAKKLMRKTYWAVAAGRWRTEWNKVETRIDGGNGRRYRNVIVGGREAISTFRVLAANDEKSWVEVLPKTGRTHQIRLHCLAMGCPVLGDRVYGEAAVVPMALHARRLDFRHPLGGHEVRIEAPVPDYWQHWLEGLAPLP